VVHISLDSDRDSFANGAWLCLRKNGSMKRIAAWIASFPRFRLAVNLAGSVVLGILCNVYATQIAPDGKIKWSSLATVSVFWPVLLTLIAWFWLNLGFLNYDQDVARFADDAHCLAYVRKVRLEAYARQVQENPFSETVDARELLKELKIQKRP
jgi:hypothetical protein